MRMLIVGLLFLFSCSSDWDAGANQKKAFIEEGANERAENANVQFPKTGVPSSNQAQPF